MIQVQTQLIWKGNQVKQSLYKRLERNLRIAGGNYYTSILQSIGRWGSILIGGSLRKRIRHSNPGDPPLRQTSELYNATKYDVEVREGQLIAEISNEAAYAPTLELGGDLQVGSNRPHTHYRLVNPVKHVNYIAPRPIWVPLFQKMISQIIQILSR